MGYYDDRQDRRDDRDLDATWKFKGRGGGDEGIHQAPKEFYEGAVAQGGEGAGFNQASDEYYKNYYHQN